MENDKAGPSKWVAVPIIGKITKSALRFILLLGYAALAIAGTHTCQKALKEIDPLIDSGALPECVKTLPMGLAMVMLAGILFLFYLRKRN